VSNLFLPSVRLALEQCRPASLTQNQGEVVSSAKGDILRFGRINLSNLNSDCFLSVRRAIPSMFYVQSSQNKLHVAKLEAAQRVDSVSQSSGCQHVRPDHQLQQHIGEFERP
jgi:hypothetical protein